MRKKLRCSSLDRAIACPGAILSTQHSRIGNSGIPAMMGRAGHKFMSTHLEGGATDLRKCMASEGLDTTDQKLYDELNMLCEYCVNTWGQIKHFFIDPRIEVPSKFMITSDYELSGTMDVVASVGREMLSENVNAIVLDWKFGFIDYGYYNQIMGYAWQVWKVLGEPQSIIATVCVFPRHRFYRVHRFSWQEIKQWAYDLEHNTLSRPDTFVPSYRCATCEIAHSCSARAKVVLQTMTDLCSGGADLTKLSDQVANIDAATKTDPDIGRAVLQMLRNIKIMEEAVTRARSVLKSTVDKVGAIPVLDEAGNKMELTQTIVNRRKLATGPTWAVLQKHMDTNQIAKATTFSISKLRDAYYSKPPPATPTYTLPELMTELEDAGAIITTPIKRLELKEQDHADDTDKSKDQSGENPGIINGDGPPSGSL